MRGWLNDTRSYIEPVQIGAVMRAQGLGRVVQVGEGVTKWRIGDVVKGMLGVSVCFFSVVEWIFIELRWDDAGWTEYTCIAESQVQKVMYVVFNAFTAVPWICELCE